MSRFSKRGQWGIILAGFLGNRILAAISAASPELAPWILPIRIVYICFALMTWMAYPFFNLLLRINRFGRLVLSREQTVASNWFGLCLLCALVALGGTIIEGTKSPWLVAAIVFGFLLLPVSAVFRCQEGWPRNVMAGLTIAVALLGFGAVASFAVIGSKPASEADLAVTGTEALFMLFLIGAVASTWIANILRSQRVRR
jgi:hypothetical protein